VIRALDAAFRGHDFEDIRLLDGGLTSALVFRIVVRGNPYLLRIITRTDAFGDPTRQFACMKAAAEAGIAPRVWYADVADRLLITDFVEAKPFPDDLVPLIAPTIRRLHSLTRFPRAFNYFDMIASFMRQLQAANLLPASETEELFCRYAELVRVYPRDDSELVACHNDLKPQNILYDGKTIWLVDWEAACLNDPYADLAIAANFFVQDEAHEEGYLSAYFGEPVREYRRARFYLMQQAAHMSYATCFLVLAARSGLSIDMDTPAPDFREFHQGLISGEIDLASAEAKLQYGKIHLREVRRNMHAPRFAEALAIVGDAHAGA
jgi:aminoglycoside phosphotransferase (APT) family kinase protein